MGKKKGSNSWLTLVKRAFRSPTKDHDNKTKTSKRREEHEQEEDEKKREKRRWLFRKPSNQEPVAVVNQPQQAHSTVQAQTPPSPTPQTQTPPNHVAAAAAAERRQAIAVAVATAAAAEAAVATAQAAAEVVRLTRPTNFFREHYAALVIQTAFRGYLARRAHRALKGLVKLQALVRGHNVRKQAKMTLQCMQALVRVQNRVRDRRMRLSQDGSRTSAMNSDTNSLLERISISRDGSSVGGDWDDRPHTLEEIQAMLTTRKEAALKREKALSYAFTHQIWRSGRNTSSEDEEEQLQLEERHQWMDRWMPTKPWEGRPRGSTDQRDHNPIKTVEIDTIKPYAYSSTPTMRRPYQQQQQQPPISYSTIGSPLHKGAQHHRLSLHHSPATPSPSKTRPIQVRSASPRYVRDEDRNNYRTAAHTPRVVGSHYYNEDEYTTAIPIPSYMAATESAKARIRSQSAPRNRLSTPEREGIGSAKKRLSFPVPADPYCISDSSVGDGSGDVVLGRYVKSPGRFKRGKGGGYIGMEQQSNLSSCCTDGEISPSYANDMRRWLR